MTTAQILGMLAGYNPALVLDRTGEEAYRVRIPGLDVTVPVSWPQHYGRVEQGYGRDRIER